MRQLQTRITDYLAYAEWNGEAPGPIPPDATYCFVDVTGTTAATGDTYDPATETWTTPIVPPVVQQLRIKKTTFIEILTPEEYVSILGPHATDAMLEWGTALYEAASDPFLTNDPNVKVLLDYCVSIAILSAARADAIYAEMIAASVLYSS